MITTNTEEAWVTCRGCGGEMPEEHACQGRDNRWYCAGCWDEWHIYCHRSNEWYSHAGYILMLAEQIADLQSELRELRARRWWR